MANNMKTPKEKEKKVKRYLNGESATSLAREYEINREAVYKWVHKYNENGFDGLVSKTGKASVHHKSMGLYLRKPKNKIEELELEVMKRDIEIARLKKGYMVKGVGQQKEFVTTLDKNMK